MMGGGQDNVENPNANYMNGRGFWLFYILIIVHFHLTLLTLPIITFTVPWVRISNSLILTVPANQKFVYFQRFDEFFH